MERLGGGVQVVEAFRLWGVWGVWGVVGRAGLGRDAPRCRLQARLVRLVG